MHRCRQQSMATGYLGERLPCSLPTGEPVGPRWAIWGDIAEAWQDAQQEREQLLADARQEGDHYRDQARRAVDEANRQRIMVLEQLMGVYRDLEAVPATLEAAYQEAKNSPEANVLVPLDQKISAG